jgi:hypothetical protein
MNKAATRAVESELANVRDNLYRYRHFAKPDDPVGGGPTTVADVIKALEKDERELLEALEEAT